MKRFREEQCYRWYMDDGDLHFANAPDGAVAAPNVGSILVEAHNYVIDLLEDAYARIRELESRVEDSD